MTDELDLQQLFSVEGRNALITGGSQGIGKMIAKGLIAGGASSVYITARKADGCAAVVEELGERCKAIPGNLADEAECKRIGVELAECEDHLDILVNNAGVTWVAPFDEVDEKSFERVFALNVKGLFHLTKAVLPLLKAAGTKATPSRVINIGSIAGLHVPDLDSYAYEASKAAVHHLTRHLAKDFAPTVTVNAIAPGTFPSRMSSSLLGTPAGDALIASVPLNRLGTMEDIVGTVLYLTSRAGAYITGTVIPVDGGVVGVA